MNKRSDNQHSNEETERIAIAALRRALTTPYKSQASMIGKTGRSWTHPRKPKRKKAKESR